MSKNSRIKSKHVPGGNLGTYMPEFIEKGKEKKLKKDKKRERRAKRERIRNINNNIMNFNKGGQR